MSIEKNLQTMVDNSERIATALEGILSAISNGVVQKATSVATGVEVNTAGMTSTKDDAAETAAAEAAAKAEKAKKAAAAKAAKEEAAKAAAEADKAKGEAVSYDSIKAVVTELAGAGPNGITAIKDVLKDYGAAKASDVPEDKWGELLAKFEQAKAEMEGGGDYA